MKISCEIVKIEKGYLFADGRVISFAVQLEVLVDNQWKVIIRYDSTHDFSHIDKHHLVRKWGKNWGRDEKIGENWDGKLGTCSHFSRRKFTRDSRGTRYEIVGSTKEGNRFNFIPEFNFTPRFTPGKIVQSND